MHIQVIKLLRGTFQIGMFELMSIYCYRILKHIVYSSMYIQFYSLNLPSIEVLQCIFPFDIFKSMASKKQSENICQCIFDRDM